MSAMRKLALMPMLLLAAACVSSPPIYASATPCIELVPPEWRDGVHPAKPAPVAADASDLEIAKVWQQFGIDQTVKLVTANERIAATFGIVERCAARDAKAVNKSRLFLGIF